MGDNAADLPRHADPVPNHRLQPLPSLLLYALVFFEGFSSLGAEIVTLRRLVPHVGSAITVTAPTIGFFLLALAMGYRAGGTVDHDYLGRVGRNFLAAAALIGVGLSNPVVETLFAHVRPAPLAYLVLIAGVLCPVAWLLGQTVPILTNLLAFERVGARSGAALFWSTLGSFLGSASLSLLVMQWLGVSAAVVISALLLLAPLPFLAGETRVRIVAAGLATLCGLATLGINLALPQPFETAYATYRVAPVDLPRLQDGRVLMNNSSAASLIDTSEPPRHARYIMRLRELLLEEMALRDADILVLGAGGFTLSHREPLNRYLYVDIDPAVRAFAEEHFLREPINGRFEAADARRYIMETDARFDVVVVDAYSALTSVPSHLLTLEFWRDTQRTLKPGGLMAANLILDSRLATPFARNLLATIQAAYGACAVEVMMRDQPAGNVLVLCHANDDETPPTLYRDERNQADMDLLLSE